MADNRNMELNDEELAVQAAAHPSSRQGIMYFIL